MKSNNKQIAEAFSGHKFETTYPYLADDIKWDNVGGQEIHGKEAVIKTCTESAKYLSTVKTTFNKFKILIGENSVVIDSLAEYLDEKNEKSVVASCDIYEFREGKIVEITSYNIELHES